MPRLVHSGNDKLRQLINQQWECPESRSTYAVDESDLQTIKVRNVPGIGIYRTEETPTAELVCPGCQGKVSFNLELLGTRDFQGAQHVAPYDTR